MQNSQIHLALVVVILFSGLVVGCGRPAVEARPQQEIQAEVLPKIAGQWVLDQDATLEKATSSLSNLNVAVIKKHIETATMNLKIRQNVQFTLEQIMGSHQLKSIGFLTFTETKIVLNQEHQIEPPVIPGADETSFPKEEKINIELKDGKIHVTRKALSINVPYVLKLLPK